MNRFAGTATVVNAGSPLTIKFENAALANTTITVDIDNGDTETDTVQVVLDGDGKGQTDWDVPETGWDAVNLNHATSEEHSVAVTHNGGV